MDIHQQNQKLAGKLNEISKNKGNNKNKFFNDYYIKNQDKIKNREKSYKQKLKAEEISQQNTRTINLRNNIKSDIKKEIEKTTENIQQTVQILKQKKAQNKENEDIKIENDRLYKQLSKIQKGKVFHQKKNYYNENYVPIDQRIQNFQDKKNESKINEENEKMIQRILNIQERENFKNDDYQNLFYIRKKAEKQVIRDYYNDLKKKKMVQREKLIKLLMNESREGLMLSQKKYPFTKKIDEFEERQKIIENNVQQYKKIKERQDKRLFRDEWNIQDSDDDNEFIEEYKVQKKEIEAMEKQILNYDEEIQQLQKQLEQKEQMKKELREREIKLFFPKLVEKQEKLKLQKSSQQFNKK
ncbi:hypothetical protein PPERSA_01255 [Pseudocohnilembus persalinus]|uniref:Uncharacterized protein n=1 Tax=Pseudocohnilembus persalinus TaxID=266149 RepID=A0A0V0QGS8_PSEPJ|nr:hypothetical protein PPERSA_01255 [Pseudocohnilembus persalinus]|eukprot:KRX01352.1 hypothetical protein PPERSA_01255 [Pseudocohnilembus persalinus]